MTTDVADGLFDVHVGIVRFGERARALPDSVTIGLLLRRFVGLPADDGAIRRDVKYGLPERGAVAFVECDRPRPAALFSPPLHHVTPLLVDWHA